LNSGAPWPEPKVAEVRVLEHQRKLYRWARTEPARRFGDLFNLVCDRATLLVAWERVAANTGSRTAGVDATTRHQIRQRGVVSFLGEVRSSLRDGTFEPLPVRRASIPKRGGKVRYLGIPTIRDRVVQMALKLVLEPVFEAEFYPSSYGYRPGRRAQDAIAEIHHFTSKPSSYEWVVEGDIEACFDNVDHRILMGLVERRIKDRKVLGLLRRFLRAGVVEAHGGFAPTLTGTPQGGVISPLLANIYLSVLDQHFQRRWEQDMSPEWRRRQRRSRGQPNYRLVRYADDFVVLVKGTRSDAEALRTEIGGVLADQLKMTLSEDKTLVTHIDSGFDFLGFHIRRKTRGDGRRVVLTWPAKTNLAAVKTKIKQATGRATTSLDLVAVLKKVNPILRGWANYFRYGVSKRTFTYLAHYAWWRMIYWLRRKHQLRWKQLRARYYGKGRIQAAGVVLHDPAYTTVERYRYRGAQIVTPYNIDEIDPTGARFRRTGHDDQGFVTQVSEQLVPA
jgi:RNA-directed DNA polymerase